MNLFIEYATIFLFIVRLFLSTSVLPIPFLPLPFRAPAPQKSPPAGPDIPTHPSGSAALHHTPQAAPSGQSWPCKPRCTSLITKLSEEIGHIPGERVNEGLCGCWHRGNVPARTQKYPSLRKVHGMRNFTNLHSKQPNIVMINIIVTDLSRRLNLESA